MNLKEIVDEIIQVNNPSKHKSALDIFRLLDNNRKLFLKELDKDDFIPLVNGFEKLSYADPKDYSTTSYLNDYERLYGSLLYQINKIV